MASEESKNGGGFHFKKIYVIASLPGRDVWTAKRELYDDTLKYNEDYQDESDVTRFSVEFVEVSSKDELLAFLERAKSALEKTGEIPLFHFQTHGRNHPRIPWSSESRMKTLRALRVSAVNISFAAYIPERIAVAKPAILENPWKR